jgi:hypothetical protein
MRRKILVISFALDLQLFLVFNTIPALYLSQYAILEAEFGFIPLIPTQRVVQRLNISRSCALVPALANYYVALSSWILWSFTHLFLFSASYTFSRLTVNTKKL